ncbi:MAG TPA: DciA family protein [Caldimonas sp.]|jgi:hypothetical protein|nr:DciA family protein [Caldimonas sp.]HEX2539809.1 DciA family protein [Caldimonas sp.]
MQRRVIPPSLDVQPIAEALRSSAPLGRLAERMRQSNAAFAAVRPLLPGPLAAQVRPGPIDDSGWTLLCANAGVAAKLRQLAPRLEQRLHAGGIAVAEIRVKVQPV